LLREEGFAEVRYVPTLNTGTGMLVDGSLDLSFEASVDYLPVVDAGQTLTVIDGVHVGCLELRANEAREWASATLGGTEKTIVSAMATYVGLDPAAIDWVADPRPAKRPLRRRQDRRLHRVSTRCQAALRADRRPHRRQHRPGSSVIELFLLHGDRQFRFRAQLSGGDQRAPCGPSSRRPTFATATPERAVLRMVELGFSRECALMT